MRATKMENTNEKTYHQGAINLRLIVIVGAASHKDRGTWNKFELVLSTGVRDTHLQHKQDDDDDDDDITSTCVARHVSRYCALARFCKT